MPMLLMVNGVEIAESRIVGEADRLRADYVGYVTRNGGEASEVQLREWAEENLIEEELFRQEAAATQPEPTDARAGQWVAEHQEAYAALPEGERLARAKSDLRVRRLEKELRKRVAPVSEAQVRGEYDAHPEQFAIPEQLRLSHICRLIDPRLRSKATGYLELLKIRTDLASGSLTWFEALEASDTYQEDRGLFESVARGDLPTEFEEHLFGLKPGQVSDVLDLGGSSLHLFRVLAVEPPSQMAFEAVLERLGQALFEQACQEAVEGALDALKARAVIRREG